MALANPEHVPRLCVCVRVCVCVCVDEYVQGLCESGYAP